MFDKLRAEGKLATRSILYIAVSELNTYHRNLPNPLHVKYGSAPCSFKSRYGRQGEPHNAVLSSL